MAAEEPISSSDGSLPIGADGIWSEILVPARAVPLSGRPAIFMDRDGVLVEEVGFLQRPEDLRLHEGAAELIAAANAAALAVVVVTNQSGVGRGYLSWQDFAAVQRRLVAELEAEGAALDMVLACPFHPQAEAPYRSADHPDRKPNPGMLLRAGRRLGLDLGASWMLGDRARDLAAGRAAGLAGGCLLGTGYGAEPSERQEAKALKSKNFEVELASSIGALQWLVRRLQKPGPAGG